MPAYSRFHRRVRVAVLVILWVAIVLAATTHTYPTGFYTNLPFGHWCGLELSPHFGPFCDVT